MKRIVVFVLVALMVTALMGCSQAEIVSSNVSKEADMFNVQRRVLVINTRTDQPLLEVIGLLSVQKTGDGDIDIIMEVAPNVYKKHFVELTSWTAYVVEDISGAYVDKYHHEINVQPKMWVPISFNNND